MYPLIKPLVDFILAALLTLLGSPLLLLLALIIKLDSKGPVLFQQKRIGKNKVAFQIYKFRTMRTDTPKDMPTHLFENPQAFITPIGGFLRKSSLDELPQLFNILKGEMSFVGPRPALWNQYDLIQAREEPSQSGKYKVSANERKPGITGWAQVNGRDELPIKEKAALDRHYAANMSFLLDGKILFLTFFKVLKREGIQEGDSQNSKKQ
ncbi:MAG: sugar transferase [Anaerovorax sp.]